MYRAGSKTKRRSAIVLIFAIIIIAGALSFTSQRQDRLYTVTVLPTLGGKATLPCAINDNGQIVGLAQTPDGKNHIFLWDRENGMKDLGSTDETELDINNAGQIAGTTQDTNGNRVAFLWDPNDGRQMLGAQSGVAHSINDAGQVIGMTVDSNVNPPSKPKPCFWDSTDDAAEPLPDSSEYRGGSGLNNGGYVLDRMFHWDKFRYWVYLWRKDTGNKWLFELEQPAGSKYFNDANQVLYGEKHYSVFWRLSSKHFPPYPQYYLWDPRRGRIPLDCCVKSRTGELLSVRGLNNKGCIIGTIQQKSGANTQAVLFEPIPERWEK